jgi:hypothetical protein
VPGNGRLSPSCLFACLLVRVCVCVCVFGSEVGFRLLSVAYLAKFFGCLVDRGYLCGECEFCEGTDILEGEQCALLLRRYIFLGFLFFLLFLYFANCFWNLGCVGLYSA